MSSGRAEHRTHRRGTARAAALAVLVGAGCAARPRQPAATDAALARLASAARVDVDGRGVALETLLAGRAVIYFFRTDCAHCAAGVAAARALAARPGAPALVLVSREGAPRLRAVFGPSPRRNLTVLSDVNGAIMDSAVPTRFVPRIVGVERFVVRLDATGDALGLADAVAALGPASP